MGKMDGENDSIDGNESRRGRVREGGRKKERKNERMNEREERERERERERD